MPNPGLPDEDQFPHATGAAAKTVEQHRETCHLILYGSWFCPFVQRAWIVLQELGIDYQYVEVNPYKKDEEYLRINPKGLVPALAYHGRSLNESAVIMEFLEDISQTGPGLLPKDPFDRAVARIWMDHIAKKICPAFFRVLLAQEPEKQKEAQEGLLKSLTELVEAMDDDGPFFRGQTFSLVDVMLIPWLLRNPLVMKEFKNFEIPSSGSPTWDRFHRWLEACKARPSVVETTSEPQHYRKTLERYANNTAQSEAAQTIRAGGTFS